MLTKVNKAGAAVLDFLWSAAENNTEKTGYVRFDRDHHEYGDGPGAIMSVTVELLPGEQISIAHYYKQNGDMMRDPEIVFWRHDGEYYPMEITQDATGTYNRMIEFSDNRTPARYMPRAQRDAAIFAGQWMRNIAQQQALDVPPRPPTEAEKATRQIRQEVKNAIARLRMNQAAAPRQAEFAL